MAVEKPGEGKLLTQQIDDYETDRKRHMDQQTDSEKQQGHRAARLLKAACCFLTDDDALLTLRLGFELV